MNQTVTIGPLTFSAVLLLGLLAAMLGAIAGAWTGREQKVDVEPLLFRAAVIGFIVARIGFVVQFHDNYLASPLSALDIRDGGWMPLAGFAAGAIVLVALAVRRPVLRKPLAAAVGVAALVGVMGAAALASLPADGGGGRLPQLALEDLQGRPVSLSTFHGKPTVVNLWATWCPPCRRELPALRDAQAQRTDVNFVFLDQSESPEKVRHFLAAQQLPLANVLLDLHGRVGEQLGTRALPTTFFFDAQGRLTDARVGELSPATLTQRLAALTARETEP
jgi:thiol-disulfide isomerase/thioredoxin